MSNFKTRSLDISPPPSSDAHDMGRYLWGVETVKRFVNVHFHCIVSNLKRTSKLSMLPPLEKFLRTSMVTL